MYSEEELLDEIRRLADGDTPPTGREMKEHGKFAKTTYHYRFNSWNEAVRRAGLTPREWTEHELLEVIQDTADGSVAPPRRQAAKRGDFGATTCKKYFTSWWQAVVRAGLKPYKRRPLTDTQFEDFFVSAVSQSDPTDQIVALLHMFTGLPPRILEDLSNSWITRQPADHVVVVPETHTVSGEEWMFKIPKTWTDGRSTTLPDLFDWYFDTYDTVQAGRNYCQKTVHKVAEDASINRNSTARQIRPEDLRATGGVRMARNNAPPRQIKRHIGIEHTGWQACVDDFLLYCYIHYDHNHPNYEPPRAFLNPV